MLDIDIEFAEAVRLAGEAAGVQMSIEQAAAMASMIADALRLAAVAA